MMALEALSTSELLNYIIYDTLSTTPFSYNNSSNNNNTLNPPPFNAAAIDSSCSKLLPMRRSNEIEAESSRKKHNLAGMSGGGGRKKRRRRPKVCKSEEEAETQRMTHIAVERNRRKQMNEHLAVLKSLMPESYVQRGDQASIVGGAVEYVKELEHVLQSLEAQKLSCSQYNSNGKSNDKMAMPTTLETSPFGQFFSYPQYKCSQFSPNNFISKSKASIADIEVTLIETHANIRVLARRRVRQLSKMVAAFHTFFLTTLHLNVITLEPLVLYSINAKVEEGCQLSSSDEIAGAVHHVLKIIEEEASLLSC
ncbi:hypothetical protein Leryth_003930 [Lithospermum erythrorhizon]|nr:hypothetical protein Leryth_003930 [Lithospermum erythrorhizon]